MTSQLDQRIDDLLGDELVERPVFLEMSEETATKIVDALRWALYGGQQPPQGRRALLVVLDALALSLSGHEAHG